MSWNVSLWSSICSISWAYLPDAATSEITKSLVQGASLDLHYSINEPPYVHSAYTYNLLKSKIMDIKKIK